MSERNDGERERDVLLEAVLSAYRERDRNGVIQPHPAWWDLLPEDREVAFEQARVARLIESALDERGLSTTGREVLRRIVLLPQL